MSAVEEGTVMSKSAKRRAAKKARDAAEEVAPEPPKPKQAPAPAPAPTPVAPKAAGKAAAKAKAQSAPAAAPAPAPKAATAPKTTAAPKAATAPQPAAPASKAEQPKAASKAKAKAKGKAESQEPAKPKEPEVPQFIEFDDGKGGEWEQASAQSKKHIRQQERKKAAKEEEEQKKKEEEEAAKKAEIDAKKAAAAKVKQASAKAKAPAEKPKAQAPSPAPAPSTTQPAAAAAVEIPKPAEPEKPAEPTEILDTVVMEIPDGKMGRIIGPRGSNIEMIQRKTGIKKLDTSGGNVTIIGVPAAVPLAEAAVRELIERGYMSLSYDDFAEGGVQVHPQMFPEIIGSRGAVINEIKKATNVEIKIPEVPKGKDALKGAEAAKKYKIEIVGDKENVDKAKDIINSILMYGHHEETHPGVIHQELDVDSEHYRFIIGRGGQELRHTQNFYEVRVNIPREHSVNKDKVVVIGEPSGVERAVKHIEKQIADGLAPKPDKEKAQDRHWSDDEDLDSAQKAYIIKRR